MSKNRAFVKYTKSGKIIPGGAIVTNGHYPDSNAIWKEVPVDLCCATHVLSYNLVTGATQNPDISGGGADAFPWSSGYISLQIGCAAMDPNTEWAQIYIPGNPTDIYELLSILNTRVTYLGTWEVRPDNQTLVLNTDSDVAKSMCPSYLPNNLIFNINAD